MQDIEQQASLTYLKNLEFLEKDHYDVWYKLHLLDLATEDGRYKEKYALEYVDGYFDVMELSSHNYLYASNSLDVSKQFSKQINLKKDSLVFDGFPLYYQYEQGKLDDKTKGLEDIYPLMTYYLDHRKPQDEMQEIEKFIFIGVGLGMHIIDIHEKIGAEEYFIIEDNLELFKLSLFTTPYYKLNNSTLFFSIGDDKEIFTQKFKTFLENSFFRNKYLKYHHFPKHSTQKINLIKNTLASQEFSSFPYKINLSKYIRALKYLNSGYKFLNLAKQLPHSDATNKPLLIVASGPSLDKNLLWLKENYSKFVILALSATLKTLHKHKITPDIVTHLDGFKTSLSHFEGFSQKEFLQNCIAIVGSFTPPEVLEYFPQNNIYITEEHGTYYNQDFFADAGPCVGSTSIMWSLKLGFNEVYLLGIDLALGENGNTHSTTHKISKGVYDTKNGDTLTSDISFRKDFFKVKGNFREEVQTNSLFYTSIFALNTKLPKLKKEHQNIYNLNDGAFIERTISIHSQDINTQKFPPVDSKLLHQNLKSLLQDFSKEELSQDDISSLQFRLNFTKEIKKELTKYKESPLSFERNTYLYNLLSLSLALLQDPTREQANLVYVYDLYLSYAMPIIFDFFNTKNTTTLKKDIKKLDKILLNGASNIEKDYEEAIESFFNSKM